MPFYHILLKKKKKKDRSLFVLNGVRYVLKSDRIAIELKIDSTMLVNDNITNKLFHLRIILHAVAACRSLDKTMICVLYRFKPIP